MQDPLKQFMQANRAAFDEQELPMGTWENLAKQLPLKRPYVRLKRMIAVAASILVLFGFGVLTGVYLTNEDAPMVQESPQIEEYKETEAYYSTLVNQKMDELKSYQQKDALTSSDITELEAAFMEWKQELGPDFTDDEVMGIMVQHYQRKIEILEETLDKIKTTKQPTINL